VTFSFLGAVCTITSQEVRQLASAQASAQDNSRKSEAL
jgi:hypothetical protein